MIQRKGTKTQRKGGVKGVHFFLLTIVFLLRFFLTLKKNCILLEENSKLKKRMPGFTTHLKNLFDIHAYVNYLYFHQAKRLENKS